MAILLDRSGSLQTTGRLEAPQSPLSLKAKICCRAACKASIAAAHALADAGADFTVLHVAEAVPAYVAAQIPSDVLAKTREEMAKQTSLWSKRFSNAAAKVVTGHAGRAIVDYAVENGIDCIVLASHRPGLENLFLGSIADRVVRHAKCSVHVIR